MDLFRKSFPSSESNSQEKKMRDLDSNSQEQKKNKGNDQEFGFKQKIFQARIQ